MSARKRQTSSEDISWHPAFVQALERELAQYKGVLQFMAEYQLTAEPLRIDVVVIKKLEDVPLTKNIAAIFRSDNLLEYKSPTDYLSVEDFYKVYGYGCLYVFLKKVKISDLTLTFVESRYPRNLLSHLKKVHGYQVEERSPGIYTVLGDIIPIQIIDSRKLSEAENFWLNALDNNLDAARLNRLTTKLRQLGKTAQIGAYIDAIFRANAEKLKEVYKMRKNAVTLEQVLEEIGLTAKWEAKGTLEGKLQVARNLIKMGESPKKVAQAAELDIKTVKALIKP